MLVMTRVSSNCKIVRCWQLTKSPYARLAGDTHHFVRRWRLTKSSDTRTRHAAPTSFVAAVCERRASWSISRTGSAPVRLPWHFAHPSALVAQLLLGTPVPRAQRTAPSPGDGTEFPGSDCATPARAADSRSSQQKATPRLCAGGGLGSTADRLRPGRCPS